MQKQAITPDSATNPSPAVEASGSRFEARPETKGATGSTATKPKSDFWSAAGAIFAQQNRIPRLTRSTENGSAPLSLAQERLWTLEQSEQGAPYYHVALTWRITGELNVQALDKSLQWLVQRHDILRTIFPIGPAEPM